MFGNLFVKRAKNEDDYDQYWMNVSTEKTDADGSGTGEYYNASIIVRMSKEAREQFDEIAEPTAKKGIEWANVNVKDFWLKAAYGGRNSKYDTLVLFINDLEAAEEKKEEKKPTKKGGRK